MEQCYLPYEYSTPNLCVTEDSNGGTFSAQLVVNKTLFFRLFGGGMVLAWGQTSLNFMGAATSLILTPPKRAWRWTSLFV